jgi:hypothetical protein
MFFKKIQFRPFLFIICHKIQKNCKLWEHRHIEKYDFHVSGSNICKQKKLSLSLSKATTFLMHGGSTRHHGLLIVDGRRDSEGMILKKIVSKQGRDHVGLTREVRLGGAHVEKILKGWRHHNWGLWEPGIWESGQGVFLDHMIGVAYFIFCLSMQLNCYIHTQQVLT